MTDVIARTEQELERAGDDPVALARAQAHLLRAIVEELRRLNAQVEDLRRLQKQTRDRTS
jgi:cytochrome P450